MPRARLKIVCEQSLLVVFGSVVMQSRTGAPVGAVQCGIDYLDGLVAYWGCCGWLDGLALGEMCFLV